MILIYTLIFQDLGSNHLQQDEVYPILVSGSYHLKYNHDEYSFHIRTVKTSQKVNRYFFPLPCTELACTELRRSIEVSLRFEHCG